MALTIVLHRDPAPSDSTALDSTGLYRDIPLPGHPAVAEYVINPEPPAAGTPSPNTADSSSTALADAKRLSRVQSLIDAGKLHTS